LPENIEDKISRGKEIVKKAPEELERIDILIRFRD